MTRKNFNALAEIVARVRENAETAGEMAVVSQFEMALADYCSTTNANFDYGRFVAACQAPTSDAPTS